ncbi:hypothetical protein B0H10DRAFT_1962026 [Mycena sp. CBHHK59/15]|nr:hypothetical protein B0H10DRAFT_1962026 [Mycena sp. CBHHK59/15]
MAVNRRLAQNILTSAQHHAYTVVVNLIVSAPISKTRSAIPDSASHGKDSQHACGNSADVHPPLELRGRLEPSSLLASRVDASTAYQLVGLEVWVGIALTITRPVMCQVPFYVAADINQPPPKGYPPEDAETQPQSRSCGWNCPAIWRQIQGLRGIGVFCWGGFSRNMDDNGTVGVPRTALANMKWRLDDTCSNVHCPWYKSTHYFSLSKCQLRLLLMVAKSHVDYQSRFLDHPIKLTESIDKCVITPATAADSTLGMCIATCSTMCILYPELVNKCRILESWNEPSVRRCIEMEERGFRRSISTMSWSKTCGWNCPAVWRRIQGLRGVGVFCWGGISNSVADNSSVGVPFTDVAMKWRLGDQLHQCTLPLVQSDLRVQLNLS